MLSNAIKFTPARGTVVVAVRATAAGVVFEVHDSGLGMTAEEIEIAFEPFSQVDDGFACKHEGTGLGLPLARRLQSCRAVRCRSQAKRESGTTVSVVLPLGPETLAAAAE